MSAAVSAAAAVAALFGPLGASEAPGVRPSVPVIIEAGDLDPCSNAVVVNLNPRGDGFLSVRARPGTKYRELTRLYNGDQVYYCARRGDWVGIVWERPWRSGCNVMQPWPVTQPYAGPCRSGWVHRRWLRIWAG